MKRSSAQIQRQDEEYRDKGKYAKVNPCYRCDKSAGVNYCSDHRSDTTINGYDVGDSALCLCDKCGTLLADMPDNDFMAEIQSAEWGQLPQGKTIQH